MVNKKYKILIITGGKVEEIFISGLIEEEKYTMIIAADRGLELTERLGILPDLIVGDFDSVSDTVLRKYRDKSIPIKTFPKEKDKTDTQLAIEMSLEYHPDRLDIVGATGSRCDHMLANLYLLLVPLQQKVEACILDSRNKLYLRQDGFQIKKENQFGEYVSLLPLTGPVTGLTLTGFKYPLDGIVLSPGSSLGISNEITGDMAQVDFRTGILLVMETKD